MSGTILLRYEELAADYEKNLHTQLRGFKQVHDFLDMWVHDADPARSLLSIAEAAQAGGLPAVEVEIGNATLSRLDRAKLLALVGKVGRARLDERPGGGRLHIDLD